MNRRRWKNIQPTSLRHGLELCKDFAKEAHNMSVERIAVEMGVTDQWTVYKWLQTGPKIKVSVAPNMVAYGSAVVINVEKAP